MRVQKIGMKLIRLFEINAAVGNPDKDIFQDLIDSSPSGKEASLTEGSRGGDT